MIDLPMIKIPGGAIILRDDRTGKKWQTSIKPFLLAQYPVTQGFYASFADNPPATGTPAIDSNAQKPVVDISWLDAVSFCNRLSQAVGLQACYELDQSDPDGLAVRCDWQANGYRLPSEAEWEFACRAGSSAYRYGELDQIAWYAANSGGQLHDVGQKEPNAWGLHDMLGNVWEWCWDLYDPAVYGPYRIFRGGGWSDAARSCGASCRRRSHPTFSIDDLGFRLARLLET